MLVIFTPPAETDLEAIGDYIAARSPARALTFVLELRDKCESLADAPRAYPLVPRYEHAGIRRRRYGDYLIFYRIGVDTIDIVHILQVPETTSRSYFPRDSELLPCRHHPLPPHRAPPSTSSWSALEKWAAPCWRAGSASASIPLP
jgi:toxin ParE1/3/4